MIFGFLIISQMYVLLVKLQQFKNIWDGFAVLSYVLLYARYLCSCMQDTFARARTRPKGQARARR